MKPSNYIFNTDTQSLGNYLDGSGSLSVSSGQVINGPAILDSIIVSAVEDSAVLKMAVRTSDDLTRWFPYKVYVTTVPATVTSTGSTIDLRVYLSAHRLSSGELYFCICSGKETSSTTVRINQDMTFEFRYRLITQPA